MELVGRGGGPGEVCRPESGEIIELEGAALSGNGGCGRVLSISSLTGSRRTGRARSSAGAIGDEPVGDLGGDTMAGGCGGETKRTVERLLGLEGA